MPFQTLGINEVWNYCIRTHKPPNRRVIIPGAVVIETSSIQPLSRELLIRRNTSGPRHTEGQIADTAHKAARAIRNY